MASIALPPPTDSPFHTFFKAQFLVKPIPPPSSTCFCRQTVIVTGSNSGIGLAAVRVLLEHNVSHIIMAVRTIEKGEVAAAPLRKAHPHAEIEVWPLDMCSYKSVQSFAERCTSLPRLDKVVLNAGVEMVDFVLNPDTGHEETIQVNYLSTVLLSLLLLPIIKSKKIDDEPGRLTIVASGLALQSKFANRDAEPLLPSFDDPTGWGLPASLERYGLSKTLLLMFLQKISEVVDADDIIINTIEPGFVAGSGLQRNVPAHARLLVWVVKAITGRSTRQGAWAYADAVAVKGKESHGGLVMNWEISGFHPMMYEENGRKTTDRLWEETLDELSFANVRGIVDAMGKKS